jgi:ubiquinol-cytochrome c reductase cytochrome b subunit
VQINSIWEWGPTTSPAGTNGAQPDWYLGWLIGALRLMPGFDVQIGSNTLVPNPFWGGVAFRLVVFGLLALWPTLERRVTGDRRPHNLLDRPRDAPWRTALGMGVFMWVMMVFLAGASDRVLVTFGISYVDQIWVYRVLIWVVPVVTCFTTKRLCDELREHELIAAERERAEAQLEGLGSEAVG